MLEPAVGRGAVPVLDAGGDVHRDARRHLDGGLAPFLVVAAAGGADEDLPAAGLGVVDVPVVAAAGLERHAEGGNLRGRERVQVAAPREILRVGRVERADRDRRPVLREGRRVGGTPHARDDGVGLLRRDAVAVRDADVRLHLRLGLRPCRERGDGDELARPPVEDVAREDVAEEVRLEIGVELRVEVEERAGDGHAAELRLVCRADFKGLLAEGEGLALRLAGTARPTFFALCLRDSLRLDLHQGRGGVERPREAAVGVELPDDLLGLIERESGVEAGGERGGELVLLAARDGGADVREGGVEWREGGCVHCGWFRGWVLGESRERQGKCGEELDAFHVVFSKRRSRRIPGCGGFKLTPSFRPRRPPGRRAGP